MKKFLIALLGLFCFTVASVNAIPIQRDVGGATEVINSAEVEFDAIVNEGDFSSDAPVNFCQRTEELLFCEATPLIRSSVFAEFIWPNESIDNLFIYNTFDNKHYKPIYVGKFPRLNLPHFI